MHDPSEGWVRKGEGDARTEPRELAAGEAPNWDAVCFHAQQVVEKYLKALLVRKETAFPRTHDLRVLLELAAKDHPDWRQGAELALFLGGGGAVPGRGSDAGHGGAGGEGHATMAVTAPDGTRTA